MIERYTNPEMKVVWSDKNKFQKWFEVECSVLEEFEKQKLIPSGVTRVIRKKAKIDCERILTIEKETKHDVIAFCTSIAERCGNEGRYFHYGLTSSDVVDTGLSLLIQDSMRIISDRLELLLKTLKSNSIKYKKLTCIGRTHGMHAEPSVFGLKYLSWYAEFKRQKNNFMHANDNIRTGKLSGAVGTYGIITPSIEKNALSRLGLKVEDVSTQIIPRDRHAQLFAVIANIGGSIERVATEIRHLQRTEVNELEEGFSKGQKGSSAMPHKKNPIASENLSGCARLLRGYALSAFENIALWHERDISHSSVERVILPDAFTLLEYMLKRLNDLIENLIIKKEQIEFNLNRSGGVYFSGHLLIQMVEKGLKRESAYKIIQACAHQALEQNKEFKSIVLKNNEVMKRFTIKEINEIMKTNNFLKNIDQIYKRVLG